ncbi:MAG: hypothetical protein WBJ41_03980 [Chromatiaceae bacterium]
MKTPNQLQPLLDDLAAIPVVVGVSGHCDLVSEDLAVIRRRVRQELMQLASVAKHSPRLLLTALAMGADQLVAQEALALGWSVIAVLPMPLADFEADFAGPEELGELRRLLARCRACYEIPWAARLDPDITARREQQYRDQGVFVARQSQVILALWDGSPRQPGACGTALVVDLCRQGTPSDDGEILSQPETSGLIHIPVRRQKDRGHVPHQTLGARTDTSHVVVFTAIDTLNRATQHFYHKQRASIDQSLDWLLPADKRYALKRGGTYLAQRYAELDVLSTAYQRRRKQVIQVASGSTILAGFTLATYYVFLTLPWFIAYALAICLAYLLYFLLFRMPLFQIEDHYLEYRALTEAIRVQFFWRLSGLTAPVAGHYLQLVQSNVGWIREAMINLHFASNLLEPEPVIRFAWVREHWVEDQEAYFLGRESPPKPGKATLRRLTQNRFERAALISFFIGVGLVGLEAGANFMPALAGFMNTAISFSASFFLVAAILKGYATTMGYEEEAASFEQAGGIFRNARVFLDHTAPADVTRSRSCVLALGKYALAENAQWLLLHRRNAFHIQN